MHPYSLNTSVFSRLGGYGAKLLNLRRDPLSVVNGDHEFPLILGRDVSGIIVDCGSDVTHFVPGDEVGPAPITQAAYLQMRCKLCFPQLQHFGLVLTRLTDRNVFLWLIQQAGINYARSHPMN